MEPSFSDPKTRRKFLAGSGVALGTALAGCGTDNSDSEEGPNGTATDRFHTPNKTVQSTKTPEPVATETNTPETSTEETATPRETTTVDTETPTPTETQTWEDLTGEQVYTNNLPPSSMQIKVEHPEKGEYTPTTLGEWTERTLNQGEIFTDNGLETLKNIGRHGVKLIHSDDYGKTGHMNSDAYQFVEHILHTEHDIDEARVFQDVSRPRESGFLNNTVVLDDQLYMFAANHGATIQPLHQTDTWDVNNANSGNAIDYQGITQAIQEYGGWKEMPDEGFEGYFERLGVSLSYDNSDEWLLPTRDFHSMAGAVHHYAMDQDVEVGQFDGISLDDFEVSDVVDFRDEVNDLKQEHGHDLGEDERIVMDAAYEDGDYQLEAEITDEWGFADGFAESII